MWAWLLCLAAAVVAADAAGAGAARFVCYVENSAIDGFSECTHLVYAGDARGDKLDGILKEYRKNNPKLKIVLRVAEIDKDLPSLLKSKHVQGLEIYDAHKSLNRTKIMETVEAARSAISSSGGGPLFLALPAHPELLSKYYDLRSLLKKVDLMMVQTHALGLVSKTTYHPSRLSGLWDMMNTDSVVDLVVGLGVPASKIVISLPATARKFTLLNETLSTPGSPTVDDEPKEIDQSELCRLLQKGRWTLERDQDLSAPYAFQNKTWISFEDSSSVDVKGKYVRVRGLAGLALHKADRDAETPCGSSLRASLAKVLNQQSRAPRAAVLRSLEHDILSVGGQGRALDALQVSPYRITQVVDSDGVIHSIREDTRTEFTCSRQGYFVHPRSCARFYRCVKFDQLSPEYTVFEFDCPAGLAFDSRYEVCVWPGSLPHSQACPGSSEIAPVPQTRFICPEHEGYYADPENCRWFFACLDHGKAPLTAYEFRCPFGLGFDAERLACDWPWLVPACGNIGRYEAEAHGFSGAILTGAAGFHGQTADSINIAAHQSLVSGASLDNLVGIQSGFLSEHDALDSNFIASQELANGAYARENGFGIGHGVSQGQVGNGLAYQSGSVDSAHNNLGLVQTTKYNDEGKYTSGSIILDDYRLPTKSKSYNGNAQNVAQSGLHQHSGYHNKGYSQSYVTGNVGKVQYESGSNYEDNSGAYVHDPSGDYAEPYRHEDSPVVPYVHSDETYKQSSDYYDFNRYSGSSQGSYNEKYQDNSGQYVNDNSGAYVDTSSINGRYKDYVGLSNGDYSDSYKQDNSGKYEAGVYRVNGHIGTYNSGGSSGEGNANSEVNINQYHGAYSAANSGNYISDTKAYTGASHTLTAGAINVGLVGKTTLVDAGYTDQTNAGYNYESTIGHGSTQQTVYPSHVSYISQPAYIGVSHTSNSGAIKADLTAKTTLVDTSYTGQANSGYNFESSVGQGSSHKILHPGHVSYISQPAVSIQHLGTDSNNLDGYSFVTTPTSSGVPTTATPIAFTTALPTTTYKTTYVPEPPKTSIKQIFGYNQPAITYVKPTVVAIKQEYMTPKVQVTDYNTGINSQNAGYSFTEQHSSQSASQSESSGYQYTKPNIKFEDGITYTTPAPIVSVSTYKPQGFSHSQQTLHKVASVGFDYSTATPVNEPPFEKIVAYTTGPSVSAFAQPTVASVPQSVSHQTIHKIETSNIYNPAANVDLTNNEYIKSGTIFGEPKQIIAQTTPQPVISSTSTYLPQVFNHQTLHEVDIGKINSYSQSSDSGYVYQKPEFEEVPKNIFTYPTQAPAVSTYRPQAYSHQTIHKTEKQQYVPVTSTPNAIIEQPKVSAYQNPFIEYTQKVTPATYDVQKYTPQTYSHQTIHKTVANKVYTPSVDVGSTDYQSTISYQAPKILTQYTTAQPAVALHQVVSNYQPQVISHQTLHNVEASKIHTYSQGESGYEYQRPAVKYEEEPKTVIQHTTTTPVTISTYKPQSYRHQTIHKFESQNILPVSSTTVPKIELKYQQPSISVYENPFLKYTQKETYVTPTAAIYTEKYKPVLHQHEITHTGQPAVYIASAPQPYLQQNIQFSQEGYSYSQPEIQRNDESLSAGKTYSDATLVSHQVYHQTNVKAQPDKDVAFVSTTPATSAYEDHYADYESPRKTEYQAPEYIPPQTDYQESYTVSTASTPVFHQSSAIHKSTEESNYKAGGYSQQYDSIPVQQLSFGTSYISEPRKESVLLSTFSGNTKYEQIPQNTPDIQLAYRADEYLPPIASTAKPIVTSTYKLPTYTKEYLPPSTTTRPIVKLTTQEPTYKYVESTTQYKAPDYLPPVEDIGSKVLHFESFGLKNKGNSNNFNINYNANQEYRIPEPVVITSKGAPVQRKQNIVVETAKSNLLGFGTVGPDAGLVSPVTYTTARPVVYSTYRPIVKTTPIFAESTTQYKAPEYLPPIGEVENINLEGFGYKNINEGIRIKNPYRPVSRKQNIVVETAKSQLLGYGTVGSDASLVTYSTQAPIIVSSTAAYSQAPRKVTTPIYQQEIIEVTPPTLPVRRVKPKVAVVTKINDFNPLLVRKLGAVCSCQSPVLVLKGKRPNVQETIQRDFDDYSNDYDDSSRRGDISENEWAQRSAKLRGPSLKTVISTPVVSSTLNPIIVPDDSYYQDLQEENNYESFKGREIYSENYVSSTPVTFSTTAKNIKIRPRVTSVTVAPTYKTVLLNQEVAPVATIKQSASASAIDSQAFDRYGPGGWRSRDETLQGSVDCQRAGLFRHPKQCNKFYACRWDCTKQRFTLHVFNCPVHLSFDESLGACNWPSQGPSCQGNTLLTNAL